MKSRVILLVLGIFLATPLWMRIAWEFSPVKKLNLAIVDKTVLNANSYKHRSINWILDHEKYAKSDGSFYDINRDYFGFFPGDNERYTIRDFDTMSEPEVDSTASSNDLAYFADTYGVLGNEWYRHRDRDENSGSIYGGLSEKDLLLIRKMREKDKLIIAEFNTIGFPTPSDIRKQFEELLGIRWTGWMARSITSLDTVGNPDLPKWIIRNYKRDNQGVWNFKKGGMLFIHESGTVLVLEEGKELKEPIPSITAPRESRDEFGIPGKLIYPYWMDIWQNYNDSNNVVASYEIPLTPAGTDLLERNKIPVVFPAILRRTEGFRFYYFCGDFADNPTKFRFAQLEGITSLKFLMYNAVDVTDRNRFFWEFYLPLMQSILKETYLKSTGGKGGFIF